MKVTARVTMTVELVLPTEFNPHDTCHAVKAQAEREATEMLKRALAGLNYGFHEQPHVQLALVEDG